MSKDEVKCEHKQNEGDPVIKGDRRRLAREMANSAPRPRVGAASVMVVNPTHYAVAIRYAPEENPLPVIIAKGYDQEAALLRREAQLADVPIVDNPPVARALTRWNSARRFPRNCSKPSQRFCAGSNRSARIH